LECKSQHLYFKSTDIILQLALKVKLNIKIYANQFIEYISGQVSDLCCYNFLKNADPPLKINACGNALNVIETNFVTNNRVNVL